MEEKSPQPISAPEHEARKNRVESIARQFGFVGSVEYRHISTTSGGAHYGIGASIDKDVLVAFPRAFQRDLDPDDFSLEAIIAHERGHQLLCRHERLRRNVPKQMSALTEEVLASLAGSVITDDPADGDDLTLKALFSLTHGGMPAEEASGRVKQILTYLEAIL